MYYLLFVSFLPKFAQCLVIYILSVLSIEMSRLEDFTVMKIQAEAFWVVMPCNVVVGYQHFRGP
jgi:hypothetical protein